MVLCAFWDCKICVNLSDSAHLQRTVVSLKVCYMELKHYKAKSESNVRYGILRDFNYESGVQIPSPYRKLWYQSWSTWEESSNMHFKKFSLQNWTCTTLQWSREMFKTLFELNVGAVNKFLSAKSVKDILKSSQFISANENVQIESLKTVLKDLNSDRPETLFDCV